jgi:hypothetical protein
MRINGVMELCSEGVMVVRPRTPSLQYCRFGFEVPDA